MNTTTTTTVATPVENVTRTPRPAPKAPKGAAWTEPEVKATAPADPAVVAELARLRAENARLTAAVDKAHHVHDLTCKVSDKRGMSVYGLGRFPVTLYKEQWARLFAFADEARAFLKEHDAELKAKGE